MADNQNAIIQLVVPPQSEGLRLDRFIAGAVDHLSRQRVKALLSSGQVRVGGKVCDNAAVKLAGGEDITIAVPPAEDMALVAEDMPLTVVYEDDDLIVIDKPAGLVVHPAPGHATGTLVHGLMAHVGDRLSGIGGVKRPGIVHRLDKDTSGLLVVAKSDAAHKGLSKQFAAHGADGRLERTYAAVVWGAPERNKGKVDAALGRSANNRRKIAVVADEAGRHAVTHYRVEERFTVDGAIVAARLQLALETGRTHQIRVHMSAIGHPLLGDKTYGAGFKASSAKLTPAARDALGALNRQALHAATLAFEHPLSGAALRFESVLPDDIAALVTALRQH